MRHSSSARFRSARRAIIVGAAALAVGLAGSWSNVTPASAHDGDAELEVDQAHPFDGGVHYIVYVKWVDDDHPAEEATVTATPTGPAGELGDPVPLSSDGNEPGFYDGELDMAEPGDWTVVFSSLEPDGDLEHTETVEASDTEEAAEPAEADDADEPGEPEERAGAGGAVDEEALPEVAATNDDAELTVEEGELDDDSDDGPSLALLIVGFAVLAAVVAGVFGFVTRSKGGSAAGDGSSGDAAEGDGDGAGADAVGVGAPGEGAASGDGDNSAKG